MTCFRFERLLLAGLTSALLAPSLLSDVPPAYFGAAASPNPSDYGDNVLLSGCLYNTGGGGSVTFVVDGNRRAPLTMDTSQSPICAKITLTGLATGLHSVTASYSGGTYSGVADTTVNVVIVVDPPPTSAQYVEQGPELIGAAIGGPYGAAQGVSVALSADGNTALIGGPTDNSGMGAAWVFVRSRGIWSQQGGKLSGTDAAEGGPYPIYAVSQGWSVALSADGNTALVGGPADNAQMGAAWVYTRSGGVWTQQGSKLIGSGVAPVSDPSNNPQQGTAVALSADGNTVLIGGPFDNSRTGALWAFTQSNSGWTQQGAKLVATDGGPKSQVGSSLALSADGNTALAGGTDGFRVFARSNGVWNQQGSKLAGVPVQSVALSADGNTALVLGGPAGNSSVLVFRRSGNTWSQQGTSYPVEGVSIASSADGNTILIGDPASGYGVARMFTRSGNSWNERGTRLTGTYAPTKPPSIPVVLFAVLPQGAVALTGDTSTALLGGAGDGANIGGAWAFLGPQPSVTTVTASPDPSMAGERVTLTASVTAGATGTVTFTIDELSLSPVALSGGVARIATALSSGIHAIRAIYSGDTNYLESTSNVLLDLVKPKPTAKAPIRGSN